MTSEKQSIRHYASPDEQANRATFLELLRACPIPGDQLLSNLGLFLESKDLARILLMDFLFRQITDVPGVVLDLGTRWGQNAALFAALRGIYEPFHRHRTIIAFDTFAGFPAIAPQDGGSVLMKAGQLAVSPGYDGYLSRVLEAHERANPLAHVRKFEIRTGDAAVELPKYLDAAPQTIVALAYFDFDLYEPTRACLQRLRPHLTRGSVLAFDELNDPDSPGETVAVHEVLGLDRVALRRFRYASRVSYCVVE
jgi:hypothetical protein